MSEKNETTTAEVATASGGIEVKKLGYTLYLKMPDNFLECRLSYVPNAQGAMISLADLAENLKFNKVLEGIDQDALENFAIKAAAGMKQDGVLVASGTPPVDGTDQYFSSAFPAPAETDETETPYSSVDMYTVQKFVNVAEGEELGRIIPATPGAPGRNLAGQPIPQKPGKDVKFTIGKNIRLEQQEDGSQLLVSTAIGRFCQVRGEYSVEETFAVKGDVNFKTGIIDFKGLVEVSGDVLDHFDIRATKGLTVKGNIGKCAIRSSGDVTFNGMDGEGEGSIICGGTIRARFIHDTNIECRGDIIVEVEIHNCTVNTLGRLIVLKDTISGGSYTVRGVVETNKLGTLSARHTNMLVGVDYRYLREMQKTLEELIEIQAKIKEARSLEETIRMRKIAAKTGDQLEEIRAKALVTSNAKISVRTMLFRNVRISLGNARQTINEELIGPMTIIENTADCVLSFLSSTGKELMVKEEEAEEPTANNGEEAGQVEESDGAKQQILAANTAGTPSLEADTVG